jgi:hypothetical protein
VKQLRQQTSDFGGPDRPMGQLLAQWFSERAPASAPASLVPSVRARITATPRRSGWRIRDWWFWRSGARSGTGLAMATATGVLVMALLGVGGTGFFLLATMGEAAPLPQAPGVGMATPGESSAAVAEGTPTAAETVTTAEPVAAVMPAATQDGATAVAGAITGAPAILDAGTPTAAGADVTDIAGIVTEGTVAFDDVRLSGTQRTAHQERRFEPDVSVASGALSIENAAGAWTGTFVSITPPDRAGSLRQAELVGSGEYEGLSAILRYDLGKAWGDPAMIVGVVYPGALPDYPGTEGFERYAPYWDGPARQSKSRPGASGDSSDLPAYVRGSLAQSVEWLSDHARFSDDSPQMQLRPEWMLGHLALDEPRLESRDYEVIVNADYFRGLENGAAMAGISRGSSADGGGWVGRSRGYADPDAAFLSGMHSITELTGTGAHEGLTAILFSDPRPAAATDYLLSWSVEGMLFAGDLPPHPEGP